MVTALNAIIYLQAAKWQTPSWSLIRISSAINPGKKNGMVVRII